MKLKELNKIIRTNEKVKVQREKRKKGLELLGIAIESGDRELVYGIPALLAKKDATLSAEFAAVVDFFNTENTENAENEDTEND